MGGRVPRGGGRGGGSGRRGGLRIERMGGALMLKSPARG